MGEPADYKLALLELRRTTQGSETSQYLEEKKSNEIFWVVVSERETA